MPALVDLYRHNTWANAKTFDVVLGLPAEQLSIAAPGTQGTLHSTLGHLVRVEDGYLRLLDRSPRETLELPEVYQQHDVAWFAARAGELGQAYLELLHRMPSADYQRDLEIPWFDFRITAYDGLLQVLTHSAQHRSQVLAAISARGIQTPDLDYVLMLGEGA